MRKLYLVASAFLLMLGSMMAQNQRTCAAMDVLHQQIINDPSRAAALESIEKHTEAYLLNGAPKSTAAVRIPVVFHIIYNTSAQNISDARINAQLAVLNQDFRKLNPDASSIPATFASVAADASIEFCLATVTPTGSPTNGIVRKSTTVTSFSTNDNVKRSANGGNDPWDPTRYLNIWVCNISGGVLGYAQFPGGASATDGVVLLFGTVGGPSAPGTSTPYHLGRTATHEVGHWLNLRHIWGDATCGSDLVSDTPTHNAANYGCPAFPHYSTCTGAPIEMSMNYMDYSDDACMYMFTSGQSSRMNALFAAGGARVGLTSSNGCGAVTPTCATATGLNATSITATAATLTWSAVSGAASYNVRYKSTASTSWTTTSTAGTSLAISGLVAATSYEFQVQTVCSGATASYSGSFIFNTSGSSGGSTTTVTIGTGTSTTSNAPYGTYYMDQRCQFIITASELAAAGYTSTNNVIQSLAFFTGTASTQTMNAFTIRVQHVSNTAFSNTSFLSTSGSVQVFSGAYTATSNGWNIHTFSTPFTYNGTSNLLIDICFNNSSFTSDTPVRFTSTSTNFRTLFRKSDSASGNICGTTTGTRSYDRPNMRFVFRSPTARLMDEDKAATISGVQLYPNPTNGLINLGYSVANDNTPVSIEVYTSLGSRVYATNKGSSANGNFVHTLDMSAENYPAGIYLCVMRIGETTETVRFILTK